MAALQNDSVAAWVIWGYFLAVVYAELQRAGEWIKKNPYPADVWHAPVIGLDAPTVEVGNLRRIYRVQPVDAEAFAEQPRIGCVCHSSANTTSTRQCR